MDYITRRCIAAAGVVGTWIGPRHHPRLAALGVRVTHEHGTWTVWRKEAERVNADLDLGLVIPPGENVPADEIEQQLGSHAPGELRERARAFLKSLAAARISKSLSPHQLYEESLHLGIELFGNMEASMVWHTTEQEIFGGRKPVYVHREEGEQVVIDVLRDMLAARARRIEAVKLKARLILADDDSVERWLNTEAPALDGAKPIDLLHSDAGAARVEALILGLAHGNFQ